MSKYTTPEINNSKVLECCEMISKGSTPLVLKVDPAEGAKEHDCGTNVNNQIRALGGTLEYGWIIWKYENKYFIVRHHLYFAKPLYHCICRK